MPDDPAWWPKNEIEAAALLLRTQHYLGSPRTNKVVIEVLWKAASRFFIAGMLGLVAFTAAVLVGYWTGSFLADIIVLYGGLIMAAATIGRDLVTPPDFQAAITATEDKYGIPLSAGHIRRLACRYPMLWSDERPLLPDVPLS